MKRCIAFLTGLLFAVCSAFADGIVPAPADPLPDTVIAETLAGLTDWRAETAAFGAYHVLTVRWTKDGIPYECCIGGLPEAPGEDAARRITACCVLGKEMTLTGPGLVDAEKASARLPGAFGTPVTAPDRVRERYNWGDSNLCWAGSVSDMLEITGWARRAADPRTGAPFSGEDAVFGLFIDAFDNNGAYQHNGIRWFFDGTYEKDVGMAEQMEEDSGALLPDAVPRMTHAQAEEDPARFRGMLADAFTCIARGGAVGIDLRMCRTGYPLKADDMQIVYAREDGSGYEGGRLVFCGEDTPVEERLFVYDAAGGTVFVKPADGGYADDAGNRYPEIRVMKGMFVPADGAAYPAEREENAEQYTYTVPFAVSEEETDLTHGAPDPAGQHALTVIGYYRRADETADCRALWIIDSDNDARIWDPVSDAVRREDRPDTYHMYLTLPYEELQAGEEGPAAATLQLLNYSGLSTVIGYTALENAE